MIEDPHEDLHNAIADAIRRRRHVATLVIREHPPQEDPQRDRGLSNQLCGGMCHWYAEIVVTPETVIHHCEADQRRLDRHTHFYANGSDQAWHRSPHCETCLEAWPCADIQDLMEVYEIRRI